MPPIKPRATGLSFVNQSPLSPQVGYQLIECLAIPAVVVIVISIIMCLAWRSIKQRVQNKRADRVAETQGEAATNGLPVITETPPSRDTDKDWVDSAKRSNERFNGRRCSTGLTVPLPAKSNVERPKASMPPKPRFRPLDDGMQIPPLDLGPPALTVR